MGFAFSENDIKQITKVLGADVNSQGNNWSWHLKNSETRQSLVINVYNGIKIGIESEGALVSVQTLHGYFELHDCIGFLVFEPDEIIFVQASGGTVSSLIVSGQCNCSMYTNISRDILKSDFNNLDPAVLLSAMQLSLTESILPE